MRELREELKQKEIKLEKELEYMEMVKMTKRELNILRIKTERKVIEAVKELKLDDMNFYMDKLEEMIKIDVEVFMDKEQFIIRKRAFIKKLEKRLTLMRKLFKMAIEGIKKSAHEVNKMKINSSKNDLGIIKTYTKIKKKDYSCLEDFYLDLGYSYKIEK